MTFDLTPWLRPGEIAYQAVMTVDPENLSDGSAWKIISALVVFGLLCWETERQK